MATIRAELASAYFLTASRVGAWALVSAMVYRACGAEAFVALSVARATVSLMGYLGSGVGPVLLRLMVKADRDLGGRPVTAAGSGELDPALAPATGPADVLSYAPAGLGRPAMSMPGAVLYSKGSGLLLLLAIILGCLLLIIGTGRPPSGYIADRSSGLTGYGGVIGLMILGMAARVIGEAAGALIQSRGRLGHDNVVVALGEWLWPIALWAISRHGSYSAQAAATAFALSGCAALVGRTVIARAIVRFGRISRGWGGPMDGLPTSAEILNRSLVLMVGNLADFLYAPLNQLLLGWLTISALMTVGSYAPAVQVDGALLLLTSAVSAVILPRATAALAGGRVDEVRRHYWRGTGATLLVLLGAAVFVALFARSLLHAWLGAGVPERTVEVVRLVLIHTVLGGSAGVGRAILLAAGRYRAYAAVAIGFGMANAGGVWWVLAHTSWGVKGVVGVTIATVAVRCCIWMPWYVLRVLRQEEGRSFSPDPSN